MLPRINVIRTGIGEFLLPATGDVISRNLQFAGTWEPLTLAIAGVLLPQNATHVVDIGANLGAFAIPIGKRMLQSKGKVTSFEAQRVVYYQLCGNIYLNRLDNVFAYHLAIGDRDGHIDVPVLDYANEVNIGALSLDRSIRAQEEQTKTARHATTTDQTPIKTLDALALDPADLVKIDVEGMEFDVLNGAKSWLSSSAFPPLLFELWALGRPLRANDDETSSPRKITLEGVGETSTWLCPA